MLVLIRVFLVSLVCFALQLSLGPKELCAGTVSPIQSTARPLGLDIVGPVQIAGSDAGAAGFQKNVLPSLRDAVQANLGEKQAIGDLSTIALDPGKLTLKFSANVRAYFVGEGAGYRNSLGFLTTPYDSGEGLDANDAQLILPDASSSVSYLHGGNTNGIRTASTPLLSGDFVDLGTVEAGQTITPFIIPNGANGGTRVYTPNPQENADGIQHFVSLAVSSLLDSSYLLIGVEDLFGGGRRGLQ